VTLLFDMRIGRINLDSELWEDMLTKLFHLFRNKNFRAFN